MLIIHLLIHSRMISKEYKKAWNEKQEIPSTEPFDTSSIQTISFSPDFQFRSVARYISL